jgi:hypothetical protein
VTNVVDMLDAIGANAGAIPAGTKKVAIYLTGSGGIQWTNADVEKLQHDDPELELVLRIDQANVVNVFHAVKYLVIDIEPGAASLPIAIEIVRGRKALGLRTCLYVFEAELAQVRAAVAANGLVDVVDYWEAHWGIGRAAGVALLGQNGIKAVQYQNGSRYDYSVTLADWPNAPEPPKPPAKSQAMLTAVEDGNGAKWEIHGVDDPGDVAIQNADEWHVDVAYHKGVWGASPMAASKAHVFERAVPRAQLGPVSINVHPKVAAAGATAATLGAIRGALAAFGVHVPVTPEEQAAVLGALPIIMAWLKSSGVEVKA